MARRERGLLCEKSNASFMSIKPLENMLPPVMPLMKSKARVLTNVVNKDTRNIVKPATINKAALDRQRENASKLASGRSVVHKADKENDVKKTFVKPTGKPQKLKKSTVEKSSKLTKSESVVSLILSDEIQCKQPPQKLVIEPKETEEIPLGVYIIDKEEDLMNNEFLLGLYAKDIYKFLRYLEQTQRVREDYLTPAHIMTKNMRALLVDWLFEVQQSFKLLNETIQIAVALLDRFMQDHPSVVKTELQLVGVACIFLAAKYEEMYPPDLDDLVDISAKTYSKLQILKMEQLIFSSLSFQLGRPSPSQFLRRYGRAGKVDVITYCFSKYFIDLSLVCYTTCHIPPSLIAAASLYLSLILTSEDSKAELWTPTLEYYSQYNVTTLKPVVSLLATLVLNAPKSKYQAVQKKYLDPKRLYSVSARTELKSEKLQRLVNEA